MCVCALSVECRCVIVVVWYVWNVRYSKNAWNVQNVVNRRCVCGLGLDMW